MSSTLTRAHTRERSQHGGNHTHTAPNKGQNQPQSLSDYASRSNNATNKLAWTCTFLVRMCAWLCFGNSPAGGLPLNPATLFSNHRWIPATLSIAYLVYFHWGSLLNLGIDTLTATAVCCTAATIHPWSNDPYVEDAIIHMTDPTLYGEVLGERLKDTAYTFIQSITADRRTRYKWGSVTGVLAILLGTGAYPYSELLGDYPSYLAAFMAVFSVLFAIDTPRKLYKVTLLLRKNLPMNLMCALAATGLSQTYFGPEHTLPRLFFRHLWAPWLVQVALSIFVEQVPRNAAILYMKDLYDYSKERLVTNGAYRVTRPGEQEEKLIKFDWHELYTPDVCKRHADERLMAQGVHTTNYNIIVYSLMVMWVIPIMQIDSDIVGDSKTHAHYAFASILVFGVMHLKPLKGSNHPMVFLALYLTLRGLSCFVHGTELGNVAGAFIANAAMVLMGVGFYAFIHAIGLFALFGTQVLILGTAIVGWGLMYATGCNETLHMLFHDIIMPTLAMSPEIALFVAAKILQRSTRDVSAMKLARHALMAPFLAMVGCRFANTAMAAWAMMRHCEWASIDGDCNAHHAVPPALYDPFHFTWGMIGEDLFVLAGFVIVDMWVCAHVRLRQEKGGSDFYYKAILRHKPGWDRNFDMAKLSRYSPPRRKFWDGVRNIVPKRFGLTPVHDPQCEDHRLTTLWEWARNTGRWLYIQATTSDSSDLEGHFDRHVRELVETANDGFRMKSLSIEKGEGMIPDVGKIEQAVQALTKMFGTVFAMHTPAYITRKATEWKTSGFRDRVRAVEEQAPRFNISSRAMMTGIWLVATATIVHIISLKPNVMSTYASVALISQTTFFVADHHVVMGAVAVAGTWSIAGILAMTSAFNGATVETWSTDMSDARTSPSLRRLLESAGYDSPFRLEPVAAHAQQQSDGDDGREALETLTVRKRTAFYLNLHRIYAARGVLAGSPYMPSFRDNARLVKGFADISGNNTRSSPNRRKGGKGGKGAATPYQHCANKGYHKFRLLNASNVVDLADIRLFSQAMHDSLRSNRDAREMYTEDSWLDLGFRTVVKRVCNMAIDKATLNNGVDEYLSRRALRQQQQQKRASDHPDDAQCDTYSCRFNTWWGSSGSGSGDSDRAGAHSN